MTDAITHAILRAVNNPGSITRRRSESGQMESLGTWQVRAIMGHAAPLIREEAAHNALCWQQPEDGRMVACDRAKAHKGGHSWESERELLAEAEQALSDCWKRLLVVKPTLEVPYPDAPDSSPWAKFAEPAARQAHDLTMKLRKHLKDTT